MAAFHSGLNHRSRMCSLAFWSACLSAIFVLLLVAPQGAAQTLESGFREPPQSARPRVWWHWMDGNVSISGIDKDIAWMKAAGIGGVHNFDGAIHTPKVVEHQIVFGSQEWKAALLHAVRQAENEGLEFTIASAPGWSQTGGPWVKPEQAMKKLVWSEVVVQGGVSLDMPLPEPPRTTGPFQDVPGGGAEPSEPSPTNLPELYRDAIVIAYRLPDAENDRSARITASSPIDIEILTDGDRVTPAYLPVGPGRDGWIQFDYGTPQTIRAVTLVLGTGQKIGPISPSWPVGVIQASDDAHSFRTLAKLPVAGAPQQTISFPATTARFFRLVLKSGFAPGLVPAFDFPYDAPAAHKVMELQFINGARINRFEDKAGWSTIAGIGNVQTPDVAPIATIAKDDIINLSDKFDENGTLTWTPPRGKWRIMRFGWSLTGKLNNPASSAATGLEVDKLSAAHVASYMHAYLELYRDAVGEELLGQRGIRFMLNDSYEALASNWTEDILADFQARRGYDPIPWLPALAGRVVESSTASDRFLWDFRRTLADLIIDNHYSQISDILHGLGMGHYSESHEALRAFIGDGMEAKKGADVPMGATWVGHSGQSQTFLPDIRESASVAHIYGQNLVAAESFTTMTDHYNWTPAKLKPTADLMMINGLNRFVVHASVHQPIDQSGPGLGLGFFGQWFTRKETWSDMARAWTDYLARSSFLLQQGRNVADIAWFYGEDDNITEIYAREAPTIPSGYAIDFINADALTNSVHAEDAELVAESGNRYRLLVLDNGARRMTLGTLRRIRNLLEDGVIVVGGKPASTPSLADDDIEFRQLASETWGRWSNKRVFPDIESAIRANRLSPDVDFGDAGGVGFVHRSTHDSDIYFLANLNATSVSVNASFRITGRQPEIWRADTGNIDLTSFRQDANRTHVPLQLGSHESLFVVFTRPNSAQVVNIPELHENVLKELTDPWQLDFVGACADTTATFANLRSWTESPDPAIRYFSGVATYRSQFKLNGEMPAGSSLLIDLGEVRELARVSVNGDPIGIAWKSPYKLEVTEAIEPGENELEIAVANTWANRLIGDKVSESRDSCAYAAYDPYMADSPLQPSGLIGPVRILRTDPAHSRP